MSGEPGYAAADSDRSRSTRSSFAGMVNSATTPQSKQTLSLGNTITGSLSRSLRLGKWMNISDSNCVWRFDEHDLHI